MNHPSGEQISKDGMTLTEERSELTLWAEEAAPLIAGTDIIDMARQDRTIYTNPQVIAVDQDRLGVQATVVSDSGSHWVLDKPLSGGAQLAWASGRGAQLAWASGRGAHAVVLFNAGSAPWTDASVSLDALGLDPSQRYLVRDLWTHVDRKVTGTIDVGAIPAHGSVMLTVSSR